MAVGCFKATLLWLVLSLVSAQDWLKLQDGQRVWIRLGNQSLKVEIARSPARRATGLMYRQSLSFNEGMLFIFEDEQVRHFWMKNTWIPLSIGFFDKKGVLKEIVDLPAADPKDPSQVPQYQSQNRAMFVLEVNQGWFQKHNIGPGTQMRLLNNHH